MVKLRKLVIDLILGTDMKQVRGTLIPNIALGLVHEWPR